MHCIYSRFYWLLSLFALEGIFPKVRAINSLSLPLSHRIFLHLMNFISIFGFYIHPLYILTVQFACLHYITSEYAHARNACCNSLILLVRVCQMKYLQCKYLDTRVINVTVFRYSYISRFVRKRRFARFRSRTIQRSRLRASYTKFCTRHVLQIRIKFRRSSRNRDKTIIRKLICATPRRDEDTAGPLCHFSARRNSGDNLHAGLNSVGQFSRPVRHFHSLLLH